MQNANSKFGKLAIFDEFAKMCKSFLFTFGYEFDEIEDRLNNTSLELEASFIA